MTAESDQAVSNEPRDRAGRAHECPAAVLRPPAGPTSVVLPLVGAIEGELAAGLCGVVVAMLADSRVELMTCDAAGATAGLALVDALARMQVTARRLGYGIRVRGAGSDLCALIELVGLADVLPVTAGE